MLIDARGVSKTYGKGEATFVALDAVHSGTIAFDGQNYAKPSAGTAPPP